MRIETPFILAVGELLELRDQTQDRLAKDLKVTRGCVAHWFCKNTHPSPKVAKRLIDIAEKIPSYSVDKLKQAMVRAGKRKHRRPNVNFLNFEPPTELGKTVKELIQKSGLTIKGFCRESKVGPNYIWSCLHGEVERRSHNRNISNLVTFASTVPGYAVSKLKPFLPIYKQGPESVIFNKSPERSLAFALEDLLEKTGKNQNELGAVLGVTGTAVGRWIKDSSMNRKSQAAVIEFAKTVEGYDATVLVDYKPKATGAAAPAYQSWRSR